MIDNIINDDDFIVEKVIAWVITEITSKYQIQKDVKSEILVNPITVSKDIDLDIYKNPTITNDEKILTTIPVRENAYKIYAWLQDENKVIMNRDNHPEYIGYDIEGLSDKTDWKKVREGIIEERERQKNIKKKMDND